MRAPKPPNQETTQAIAELEAGDGVRFESVQALMQDLQSDDSNPGEILTPEDLGPVS